MKIEGERDEGGRRVRKVKRESGEDRQEDGGNGGEETCRES